MIQMSVHYFEVETKEVLISRLCNLELIRSDPNSRSTPLLEQRPTPILMCGMIGRFGSRQVGSAWRSKPDLTLSYEGSKSALEMLYKMQVSAALTTQKVAEISSCYNVKIHLKGGVECDVEVMLMLRRK
jgi:hypothetical protein